MALYLTENDDYPPDVSRNIPAELEEFLSSGDWSNGAYPGSVYDWDNIPAHGYIQISLKWRYFEWKKVYLYAYDT
ncbi:MAG: hypothetical protein ACJAV6_000683 [Candidatus Paceibacteria bacterium]|jgi:hypothetical protein